MPLPADRHVHSEWSWDAADGSMERTCAQAVALGLPAVAFTEHVDHDAWPVRREDLEGHEHLLARYADGVLTPGPLDVDGYLACLARCRELFPGLRVISGVELGEPHWRPQQARELVAAGGFELVLGSVHGLRPGGRYAEVSQLLQAGRPADVVGDYLLEVERLITGCPTFAVLAHADYPARYWERATGSAFDPQLFEEQYRHVLGELAASGRALEVNTRLSPFPELVRWWRDAGGEAVTFGSDAHAPAALAAGFAEAAALVEAAGFRPGQHPADVWHRVRP